MPHCNHWKLLRQLVRRVFGLLIAVGMAAGTLMPLRPASACPFCSAFSSTLTQDIEITDAAALGICIEAPDEDDQSPIRIYRFRVLEALKGDAVTGPGAEVTVPSTQAFAVGDRVLLVAVQEENLWEWGGVGPLSDLAMTHIRTLDELPASGQERMGYFLKYLHAEDQFLANDAFNEFAMASVEEMKTVKPLLKREEVIKTIQNPATKLEMRRLHWTLLSICGDATDVKVAKQAMDQRLSGDEDQVGFDASLSCGLVLGGESFLELIDQRILANSESRTTDINSAVLAIRVHGTEFKQISRERLLESLRLVLAKPNVADLVIPDLARWEDWSQVDKMVELFGLPVEQSQYLRVPVVRYLQACPLPEAKIALEKCKEIDANAVRRAQVIFPMRAKS